MKVSGSVLALAAALLVACGDGGSAPSGSAAGGAGSGGMAGSVAAGAGAGGSANGGSTSGGSAGSAGAAMNGGGAGLAGLGGVGGSGGTAGAGGLSGAGTGGMAPAALQLKVMTFNLRYGTADDGVNAWPLRQQLTFDVFERQDADVIGIQEGLDQQLKDIDAAVTGYQRVGVGRDDGKTKGEYSAVYYRTSRFDVEASGTFWFSDTPEVVGSKTWGNDLPRICTWAHFIEKTSGRGFYQFNVHLDAYIQVAREKSVVLLMQRVLARPVATDPALVTGDFNAGEDTLANQFMRGTGMIEGKANPLPLVDSYRVVHASDAQVGTFHGFKGGSTGDKIDFIYVLPGTPALAAEIDRTHAGNVYPSDHYPVTGTLELPANK